MAVVVVKSDFTLKGVGVVQDLVQGAAAELPSDLEFLRAVQAVIDHRFPGHGGWHCALAPGRGTFAYAVKARKGSSSVVMKLSRGTLLLWRSPAIEVEDRAVLDLRLEKARESSPAHGSGALRVLKAPALGDPAYSNLVPRALAVLEHVPPCEDVELCAKSIRTRLTAELGTVWHVLVGKNHMVLPSRTSTSCHLEVEVGGHRITVFNHRNTQSSSLASPSRLLQYIDPSTLLSLAPVLLFLLFSLWFSALRRHCPWGGEYKGPGRLTWLCPASEAQAQGFFLRVCGGLFLLIVLRKVVGMVRKSRARRAARGGGK